MPLGCARSYQALIAYRGGTLFLGTLDNLSTVRWDRKLNECGEATVVVAKGGLSPDCCRLISQIVCWQHELHLYRDGNPIWQGPITDVSETRETQNGQNLHNITIAARDIAKYLDVRVNPHGFSLSGDVSQIAEQLAADACALDDPQLMRMVTTVAAHRTAVLSSAAQSVYVLSQWRTLAQLGLYWTTVGRAVYLFGISNPPYAGLIKLTADDLAASITVQQNGQLYSNLVYSHAATSGTQTLPNTVPLPDPWLITMGAPEPTSQRGYVEQLVNTYDSQTQAAVSASAQQAMIDARAYQMLRVADDSQINPNANVTVDQLMCGAQVNLARHPEFCTWASSVMQLTRVTGEFASAGEKIGITLGAMPPVLPSGSQPVGGTTGWTIGGTLPITLGS